jgi:protein O-GlcNAc transferase
MATVAEAMQIAIARHNAGDLPGAEAIYRQVLGVEPHNVQALHLLGLIAYQVGQFEAAMQLIAQAVQIDPSVQEAHTNLAAAAYAGGMHEQAAASAHQALRLRADDSRALEYLAAALAALGRLEEAEGAWRRLIELLPMQPAAHTNLGVTLERLGRLDESLAASRRAVELDPNYAGGHNNLGAVLSKLGRTAEAAEEHRQAIRLKPDFEQAYVNLGYVLQEMAFLDDAAQVARRATELNPQDPEAHRCLAAALSDQGKIREAREAYAAAARILEGKPAQRELLARVRLVAATLLPTVYESVEDVQRWREELLGNLRRLNEEKLRLNVDDDAAPTLFSLAYQGRDDRQIMEEYAKLMVAENKDEGGRMKDEKEGRIRVGFISRFFKGHTIGRLNMGLIAKLSREKFAVTVFSVGDYQDDVARFIREHADKYIVLPPTIRAARQLIAKEKIDVLFYTDLGMDPVTWTLALFRLAAVQCTTWGHPVTTGIPTVDYFLSSEALDPPDHEAHYTERLARLKNLAVYYYRPTRGAVPRRRADFGLPEEANLYGCLQMLWKFHPEFDPLLAEILRRDPRGHLVLVRGLNRLWDEQLMARFRRVMGDVADRIIWVPRQSYEDFLDLTAACDVMLDPIHFGGGNTTYESLAFGVPVITLPSKLMRGRLTLAMYRMMGMEECVSGSAGEYVEIAVALGTDRGRREDVRQKILGSNGVLYENERAVRDVEEFFESAVRRAPV